MKNKLLLFKIILKSTPWWLSCEKKEMQQKMGTDLSINKCRGNVIVEVHSKAKNEMVKWRLGMSIKVTKFS